MAEVVVSILESPYTLLQKSGVPLPVCKAKGFNLRMPNGQLGNQMGAFQSLSFGQP